MSYKTPGRLFVNRRPGVLYGRITNLFSCSVRALFIHPLFCKELGNKGPAFNSCDCQEQAICEKTS